MYPIMIIAFYVVYHILMFPSIYNLFFNDSYILLKVMLFIFHANSLFWS
jgi:hypothetical protein